MAQGETSLAQVQSLIEKGERLSACQAVAGLLRKDRDYLQARKVFDDLAESLPQWWLQQAAALTESEQGERARATLWAQLALVYARQGDDAATHAALGKARQCVMAMWRGIAALRGDSVPNFNGVYEWPYDHRREQAETAKMAEILETLLTLESAHSQAGDEQGAVDALLLALQTAVGKNNLPIVPLIQIPSMSRDAWLARIAGRLEARKKRDLAQPLLLVRKPLSDTTAGPSDVSFAVLAAYEAEDVATVKTLAERFRHDAAQYQEIELSACAAASYACLARLAARNRDQDAYQKAAMIVGGLVSDARAPAPR
ncbi:MAG: hypothetical protein WCL11_27495, partial [Verrucomicrobiota bacterium]